MKKYLFILICIVCVTNYSFKEPAGDIVIEINNLKNEKGTVLISLFNNEDDFPENVEKAVGKAKVEIVKGTARVIFKSMPYDNYAVAILHDENNNLKMDFNFLGIPKEGYGFSNNATGLFGPPSFEKATFKLDKQNTTIIIKVKYL